MASTNRQHRKQQKKLKRQRKLKAEGQKLARERSAFREGLDSYVTEYERLKRTPIVESLIGIYELDDATYGLTPAEQLEHIGLTDHSIVSYNSDDNGEPDQHDADPKAAGSTSAVRLPSGAIRPIIFLRNRVVVDDDGEQTEEETEQNVAFGIRLVLLLHELGHAEDIALGVNFDHDRRTLQLVDAEAYAHRFVCRETKKRNYRLALAHYLDDIEGKLESGVEYVRLAAQKLHEEIDVPQLKEFAEKAWSTHKGREYYLAMERLRKSAT